MHPTSLGVVSAMVFKTPSNWVTLSLCAVFGLLFLTTGLSRSFKMSSTSPGRAAALYALIGGSLSDRSQSKYHTLNKSTRVLTRLKLTLAV